MTTTETTAPRLQAPDLRVLDTASKRIHKLCAWCTAHNFDVSPQAFIDECRDAAHIAAQARGLCVPAGLTPGAPTLDYACTLVGNLALPHDLLASRLPGCTTLLNILREALAYAEAQNDDA